MPSTNPENKSAIKIAIIGGIFTVISAVIGCIATVLSSQMGNLTSAANLSSNLPVAVAGVTQAAAPTDTPVSRVMPVEARPSPTTDLIEKYQKTLMNAIDLAASAEMQAYRERDYRVLESAYTEEALKFAINHVLSLQNQNVYEVANRLKITYDSFKVDPDEQHAEVHITETWETTGYWLANGLCAGHYPPTEMPQTIYMKKTNSGWLIYMVQADNQTAVQYEPCSQ